MLTKAKAKKEKKVIKTLSGREGNFSTPTYVQFCQSLPTLIIMEVIVDRII